MQAPHRRRTQRCRFRGLVYLNNRYHDRTLGSFVSVDPLVARTGEAFVYGAANPIRYSDPSGLEVCYDDPDHPKYGQCYEAADGEFWSMTRVEERLTVFVPNSLTGVAGPDGRSSGPENVRFSELSGVSSEDLVNLWRFLSGSNPGVARLRLDGSETAVEIERANSLLLDLHSMALFGDEPWVFGFQVGGCLGVCGSVGLVGNRGFASWGEFGLGISLMGTLTDVSAEAGVCAQHGPGYSGSVSAGGWAIGGSYATEVFDVDGRSYSTGISGSGQVQAGYGSGLSVTWGQSQTRVEGC